VFTVVAWLLLLVTLAAQKCTIEFLQGGDIVMTKLDFNNNRMPMTVLILITALNIGLVINFLIPSIGGPAFGLNSLQIYVLVGLELLGVIGSYVAGKRKKTNVSF
jgi:uncharacterized membrane protein YuzA (DUF378 family)